MKAPLLVLGLCSCLCLGPFAGRAEDWPQWRGDAGRTAATGERLPDSLRLLWERVEGPREPVWDDPLNHDLMPYDRLFEPIVIGDRVIVGFNDRDKVVAYDLDTGAEVWTVYTDGPVRLPPAAGDGRVHFVSDDGHLYSVGARDGRLLWKFRGAPSARKALGNRRVVSAWPARGGPVLRDGRVYFAASIWPFMGTFLYALDAATGRVEWVNDGTGADFIQQPHSAASFAGVAPQGALVATRDTLLVPGGRSVPAAFDRATGALRYFHLNEGGKGNGGSFVAAGETSFYVHTRERGVRVYDLKTGTQGRSTMNEPVIAGDRLYAAAVGDGGEPVIRRMGTGERIHWELKADGSGDLILAGSRLYAAGKAGLAAIALPEGEGGEKGETGARVVWTQAVEGRVERLLAANGKLIAVTADGRLLAFGAGEGGAPRRIEPPRPRSTVPPAAARERAQSLVGSLGGDLAGYALVFGAGPAEVDLIDALLEATDLRLVVVEADAGRVDELRRRYDALGRYGARVSVHPGDPLSYRAPPHIASLVVVAPAIADPEALRAAYASVRPYGGLLALPGRSGPPGIEGWEQASEASAGGVPLVVREGALPGAADWTHQYGDIANTVKSDDSRVRAPLGVLWFGGNSHLDVLPRHGHGPPEQIVGGRLFLQGMNSLSARDVYTGRVIWKHDFGDLGTFGIYYNETYADTPLSTAYNQKHIPGANGRGTNYVATGDSVYVAVKGECRVLDARTGRELRRIGLRPDPEDPAQWGFIGVYGDLLLAGDDFSHPSLRLGGAKSRAEATIEDYSASHGLAVFDRHSGRPLWRVKARHGFLHNGIVAGGGRIYCLDKLTAHGEALLRRRGTGLPEDYRLLCLDARTGGTLWEKTGDLFGTWLGYAEAHDVLLLAGAKASDRLSSEVGDGMAAYRGSSGDRLWQDLKRSYTGPCILHHGSIFTGANSYANSGGVFDLLTGHPRLVPNPLTGKMEPWRLNRTYGCNTIVASEHLLTYRSGAAGYYDLETKSGTANLGGFKSGCTSNLIVADGVLNAPDYTRTCSCAYQNQTSLALVHMPEMEMWTFSQFGLDSAEGERVLRAGINFGAPGSRRAPDGTLWLEHPHTGDGATPRIGVSGLPDQGTYFRRHSGRVAKTEAETGTEADAGGGPAWVGASGLAGAGEIVIVPALRRPVLSKSGKPAEPAAKEQGRKSAGPAAGADFPPRPHTVRLYFSEPEGQPAGARVFSVSLQGRTVLEGFDIARETGGTGAVLMREFRGVAIGGDLRVSLSPAPGSRLPPVIGGIAFVVEDGEG